MTAQLPPIRASDPRNVVSLLKRVQTIVEVAGSNQAELVAELDSLRAENTQLRAARTVKLAKYTLSEEETDPRIREVRVLVGEAPRLIVNVTFGNHDDDHEVYVYDEATEDIVATWQRAGVSAVSQEGPQP